MGHMKQLAIEEEENIHDEMVQKVLSAETCDEVIQFTKNEVAKRVPYKLNAFESEMVPYITSIWNDYQLELAQND